MTDILGPVSYTHLPLRNLPMEMTISISSAPSAIANAVSADVYKRQSLDRGVDGISFGISAYNGIPGIDVRQEAFPVEDCFHIAFFLGHLDTFIHICFYSRISFKVTCLLYTSFL